jgi:hypothetical protein
VAAALGSAALESATAEPNSHLSTPEHVLINMGLLKEM